MLHRRRVLLKKVHEPSDGDFNSSVGAASSANLDGVAAAGAEIAVALEASKSAQAEVQGQEWVQVRARVVQQASMSAHTSRFKEIWLT